MSKKLPCRVLAATAAILCLLAAPAEASKASVVAHVIDGDTFELASGGRIRLIGINAPEYKPWDGRIDFYAKEARDRLRSLVSGRKVEFEYDADRYDKYGRTLAYVYLEDGFFVNLDLVKGGYAKAMYVAPNGKYYLRLKEAQAAARSKRLGLWSR